jgi:pyruvate dehydrogenase E2 component (dihydrolipoamide acetyltransferase)
LATDFTLPELGEQIAAGDVLRVLVKPGDTITKDQSVLELETDKATIEVPSSVAGVVKDVKVKAGDKVKVGQVILSVEDGGAGASGGTPAAAAASPSKSAGQSAPTPAGTANAAAQRPDAEGGPEQVEGKRRPTGDKSGVIELGPDSPAPSDARPAAAQSGASQKVVDINRGARQAAEQSAAEMPVAPAPPSVRRMARELGVDINQVAGSGPSGRISVEDVKTHAKRLVSGVSGGSPSGGGASAGALPDFSRWGEVERQPMRAVRRKTAEHLSAAWTTIPHVTEHDLADITALEELRKRYAKQVEAAGGNLTFTAIAVKIAAAALRAFPQFNASIDMGASEIVLKKFVNIGVAVDTDRGLLVPVIRDADTKNITQLSVELAQLSEKARTRKISLDEMQGGCFSISNLGGIGGAFFTPIVNAPEVAILGISRAKMEPVYHKESGQFVPRLMLPLSLSYDHRVIDGADGARFLRWVVEAFEQPFMLVLQG